MKEKTDEIKPVYSFLPAKIEGFDSLAELAIDLRWSWNHTADILWQKIDPALWELTHNPWVVLQTASKEQLERLFADSTYRSKIDEMKQSKKEMDKAPAWFQQNHSQSPLSTIAYFSMEFMLSEALPIYSGGLGNVAGDQLKAASDLGVPVIGIGLLYQQGYFRQVIDQDGAQQELLLGIGGWRLLSALGIKPQVCHLNEGHAAFAVLERALDFMKETGHPFEVALAVTRAGNLFTTHTAVPAGFDWFSPFLIEQYLGGYAQKKLGISLSDLMALGRQNPTDTSEKFNMAYLAIRGSGAINGVSRLHGKVSRHILGEAIEASKLMFDPNVLTLGFARRFATYKRPNLLLHDQQRLIRLLTNSKYPVQLIIAGKAHPADHEGQNLIREWIHFIRQAEVRSHVIFLGDYDLNLSEHLIQGVDVWINTPRRPWEACGTSGMKVLVNGGLNLSELDGWWAEAYTPEVGWAIGDGQEHGDDPAWDATEADSLYNLLEQNVIPEFYNRDKNNIPVAWVEKIRESMALLTPQFSVTRAVREYTEQHYIPAAKNYMERSANKGILGKQIVEWQQALAKNWNSIRFGDVNSRTEGDQHIFEAQVYVSDVDTNSIRVELFAEDLKDGTPEKHEMKYIRKLPYAARGHVYGIQLDATRPASEYTVRLIPKHPGVSVPLETTQIMGFTPASGIVMGTRPGNLDPGVAWYILQSENLTPKQFNHLINHESGLLGLSETSSDMHDLLALEKEDIRAAEAISLFCYQARKWIGAFTAALEGLDTLVFAGGIGENAPVIRSRICKGLDFLGIDLDEKQNEANAPIISTNNGKTAVRIIHTDEELMIAKTVSKIININ